MVNIDKLDFEGVNATFTDTTINFDIYDDTISLTPEEVFTPNALQDKATLSGYNHFEDPDIGEVVEWTSFQYDTIATYPTDDLNALLGYDFDTSSDYPANQFMLGAYQSELVREGSLEDVFDYEFLDENSGYDVWFEIDVKSHYNHLIINYRLYYMDTSVEEPERELVDSWEDVYDATISNKKLPISVGTSFDGESECVVQSLNYDNLYEEQETKHIQVLHEKGSTLDHIETNAIDYTEVEKSYDDYTVPKLNDANIKDEFILDEISDYDVVTYEVTVPEDTQMHFRVYFQEVDKYPDIFGKNGVYQYYGYILGSASSWSVSSESDWESNTDVWDTTYISGDNLQLPNSLQTIWSKGYDDFTLPSDIDVDGNGNVYFIGSLIKIDSNGNDVWEYTESLEGLGVDSNGNSFVGAGEALRKIDSNKNLDWECTWFAADVRDVEVDDTYAYAGTGYNEYNVRKIRKSDGVGEWSYESAINVFDLAVDDDGYLYIADECGYFSGCRVHKVDSDGNNVWEYTGHSNDVYGVGVDSNGYVYSGDESGELHKIDSDGNNVWTENKSSNAISDIVVDNKDYIYYMIGSNIYKVDSDGNNVWEYTGHSNDVTDINVGDDNYVYSTCMMDNNVRKIQQPSESGTWRSIIWDTESSTKLPITSFKTTSTIGSNENIDTRVGVDMDDDGTIDEWSSWITLSGGTDEDISDQINISDGYRYQIEYDLSSTDGDNTHSPTIDSYEFVAGVTAGSVIETDTNGVVLTSTASRKTISG